jgi:galactose-1-phosphate uridylyltransferase
LSLDTVEFPLVPTPKSPLAVAAENEPLAVVELAKRFLETEKVKSRNSAICSLSNDHTAMACTWLANRREGESEIDLETGGFSGLKRFFLPLAGETTYLKTKVRIR